MLDRLRRSQDAGFGLIEILAAITVFALMSTAAVPLIITGLRASTVAKLDTGAKNLAQERMETMRNLPYHVSAIPSVATSTDLLDLYYPTLTAAVGANSAGFVAAGAPRRAGEPAGGFYRTVWDLTSELGPYRQFVATQFLTPDSAPVVPPASWNRTDPTKDLPPSLLVGVTVTTEWRVGELSKRLTVFTQVGEGRGDAPIVTLLGRTTALKVSSTYGTSDLALEAGTVSIDGSVTTGASAASSALAAAAFLAPGNRVEGAGGTASAPPSLPATSTNEPSGRTLTAPSGTPTLATFGVTRATGVVASTSFGLPTTGTATSPVRAAVAGGASLSFTNVPTDDSLLRISSSRPVASVVSTGSEDQVITSGWSATTGGAGQAARVVSSAAVRTISILPTDFAPNGLVQVALRASTGECVSSRTGTSAAVTYTAAVRYWAADAGAGAPGYVPVAGDGGRSDANGPLVSSDDTTNALTALMTQDPFVSPTHRLSAYFTAMSSRAKGGLAQSVTSSGRRVELTVPAAVSVTTKPLRGDALSTVVVDLGAYSCVAEDRR